MLDSVVVSDIHLGSKECNVKAVYKLLLRVMRGNLRASSLIVNGDLFDSPNLSHMNSAHWRALKLLQVLAFNSPLEVVFLRGNHDGLLLDFFFPDFTSDYVKMKSGRRSLYITHGHLGDRWLTRKWSRRFIDYGYGLLRSLDPTQTLSCLVKAFSMKWFDRPDEIAKCVCEEALAVGCFTAICGHTHVAKVKEVCLKGTAVRYYNGGAFTGKECTFLIIQDGKVHIDRIS